MMNLIVHDFNEMKEVKDRSQVQQIFENTFKEVFQQFLLLLNILYLSLWPLNFVLILHSFPQSERRSLLYDPFVYRNQVQIER